MAMPPQYIGKNANVHRSMIADGCRILGEVGNSVLSHGVVVGKGSKVIDSVIMPNVVIGENVTIEKAMIGECATINDNVQIKNVNNEINVVSEYENIEPRCVLIEGGL